jgi:RsiW-degrading membrane proteinase PrsW (M82 family)
MSGLWVLLVILSISSIPIIAVYVWFRFAKYSISFISFLFALLAGAAAFLPALILQNLPWLSFPVSGRLGLFYDVFIRIALVEEASRLLMLFVFFGLSSRITRGKPDKLQAEKRNDVVETFSYNLVKKGTAIGLVAGLGFAILENAAYGASDSRILLLRAVTAAPLHGACGSRVGAAAVMFRSRPFHAIFRILAATAIHGIYNFMAAMPGFPSVLAVLIAFLTLISSIVTIRGGWDSGENSQYTA